MKTEKFIALFIAFLLLNSGSHAFAAKNQDISEEQAFQEELNAFNQREMAYAKEKSDQRQTLFKQLENLSKSFSTDDPERTKNAQKQVLEIQRQLETIADEMASHELESATFNVKAAQLRLKKAKENFEALKNRKKTKDGLKLPFGADKTS